MITDWVLIIKKVRFHFKIKQSELEFHLMLRYIVGCFTFIFRYYESNCTFFCYARQSKHKFSFINPGDFSMITSNWRRYFWLVGNSNVQNSVLEIALILGYCIFTHSTYFTHLLIYLLNYFMWPWKWIINSLHPMFHCKHIFVHLKNVNQFNYISKV